MATTGDVLYEWLRGVRIEIMGHYGAAKRFERYQSLIDWPTVIVSSLTATAFVSSLSDDSSITILKGTAILLSLTGTVLTSLRTFLDYGTRAKLHKASATGLTKLRREMEETLAMEADIPKEVMDSFRTRWDDISEKSPTIPEVEYRHGAAKLAGKGK